MSNIVLPTIIQGPARMTIGGVVLYFEKDISLNPSVESWNPGSSYGPLGERHKSRKDVLSGRPVGMISAALLNYFYAAFLTPTGIGNSIMAGPVVISSESENVTYTWRRGGMSKPPSLLLKPTSTAFGGMEVSCIGAAAVQPLNATFWKAANGTVSADTSFDQTKIISDIYSAALGSRSTPYNGMGGMDGFEIDFNLMTRDIPCSDLGIADSVIEGLSTTANFAPSNLTEAQADVLLGLQDTTAVLPGQAYAKALEHLVITGTQVGWVFSLKNVGAKRSNRVYQVGEHRFKTLDFVNERTWTSGVPDALFGYTAPA